MSYENSPVVNTSIVAASNSPLSYFKSPAGVTGVIKALLLTMIVLMFFHLYYSWSDIQYTQFIIDSPEYQDGQTVEINNDASVLRILTLLVYSLTYLTTWITLLVWVYRANKNNHAFGGVSLTYTPGWAVGWFLIPIVNLVMPCLIMQEIYKASRHPVQWKQIPFSPLVAAWWVCWVVGAILGRVSRVINDTMSLETIQTFQKCQLGGLIVFSIALGLLFLIITEIADFQNVMFKYLCDNPDKHPSAAACQAQTPANAPLRSPKPETEAAPLYQNT